MIDLSLPLQRWSRGASCIGREHARVGRNNQDGLAVLPDVVVVTDGCSSQPQSEVGAQLGARFLATWLAHHGRVDLDTPRLATEALTAWIADAARALGGELEPTLDTYFLFTFLAAVRSGARALVFGLGDGAFVVDAEVVRLDAGPENAPPYCAYRLGATGSRPEPQLHFYGEARSLAVCTDGLDPLVRREPRALARLVAEPALARNPLSLQRRLNVLAEAERFSDDATLALLGRA